MFEVMNNNDNIDKTNYTLKYSYKNEIDLMEYLDSISLALYGVNYRMIHFLNGNKLDFSSKNCLVNPF